MSDHAYVVDTLEKLIEISRDGQKGYGEAAGYVKAPELRKFLEEVSLERAKFAGELENEVVRLGKSDVDRSGSVLGAIRCGWIDLKGSLGGRDDEILSSIEAGDAAARDTYDKHVNNDKLPNELLGIIRNQAQTLAGALDRIQILRQQHKAA